MTQVAILGGGAVGRALGTALTSAGTAVRYGVRDPDAAAELPGPALDAPAAVSGADVVFLAVPAGVAVEALRQAGAWGAAVIVDCTNPLRWEDGPVWAPPPEGSVAESLVSAFPEVRVVKGFNHFGAEIQHSPMLATGPADAMFASDDATAKELVMDLAGRMGFRPLDAGPLRNSGLLENLAVLWIHLSSVGGLGRRLALKVDRQIGPPAT